MRSKKAAYFILFLSVLLIIGNLWNAYPTNFDTGFFLRITANILILISMVVSIWYPKNKDWNS
ncbi:hypothetical protein [Gramella sp. MAR_2010_147]|uniref:hypothetical protein n=1 Tax=Gramella sp. MAR_2010_147 TaxID=1250205 RepID=UPI00087C818D|nr:hypothetical protein [Gramella sp. MAR_2010_147]SDS67100.1 hypothetical protein SAMN04488553_2811 [Gramella sp. MAR_2010_147]